MPDELKQSDPQSVVEPTAATQPESGLSELERLMAEAEVARAQSAATPTQVEHPPIKCTHAFDDPSLLTRKCKTCVYEYCNICASILDPAFCKTCLSEPDAELKQSPLVDEDGVVHEGRVLTPDPNARFFQPRFGTLSKTISEMSEPELEDYIKRYRDLVKQAETALDFRRVVLGSAQLELSQRQDATRRRLRADKTKYPVKTLTVNKDGAGKKKTAGVADMLKMLEMLKQLQKNREAKKKS